MLIDKTQLRQFDFKGTSPLLFTAIFLSVATELSARVAGRVNNQMGSSYIFTIPGPRFHGALLLVCI